MSTLFSSLTIISARQRNQRESRGKIAPSASCQEEEDKRPDVVADNAPSSYNAGTLSGGARRGGKGGGQLSPQDGFNLRKQLMALGNFKTWPIY